MPKITNPDVNAECISAITANLKNGFRILTRNFSADDKQNLLEQIQTSLETIYPGTGVTQENLYEILAKHALIDFGGPDYPEKNNLFDDLTADDDVMSKSGPPSAHAFAFNFIIRRAVVLSHSGSFQDVA